jgi:hypothetical protein
MWRLAALAACLEDHRRRNKGAKALATVANAMAHPVSWNWAGYWQRAAQT